ncbi:MAG TPA: M48 family metallopeptidase [Sandaracinaceae bacterium]
MSEPVRGTVHRPGEAQPAPVEVTVEHGAIVARGDGVEHRIALAEVAIEAGGFDADFVFCRPPDASFTIAVRDPRFVAMLAERADPRLAAELAKVGSHRRAHRRGRLFGIAAAALVVAALVGAIASVPRMLAGSIDGLPVGVDRQLGDAAMAQVELAGPSVEDPVVRGFVEEIVARLEPHAAVEGFDFRVRVVESEQVNAFALPGGQIVMFTGLLRRAESAEQVAGVLAHEMAHVTLRHGLRNVAHQAGLVLAVQLLLGDASGWMELAAETAVLAQSNRYSREQESAADAEGVRMLVAAGLDPEGLAGFFRLLEDEPGGGPSGALSWLSTHPAHEERRAHVREVARSLPRPAPRPLEHDFAAVRRALGEPR